jgi:hypothetical protein
MQESSKKRVRLRRLPLLKMKDQESSFSISKTPPKHSLTLLQGFTDEKGGNKVKRARVYGIYR